MVDFLKAHPAWTPPLLGDGCCNCIPIDEAECPSVNIQAKVCLGSKTRPSPCGWFNPIDEEYYLVKQTERVKVTRAVTPPPHFYACEVWFDGTTNVRIQTEENPVAVPYDASETATFALDENGSCTGPTVDTTEDEYELTQYINHRHGLANTSCTGPDIGGTVPPGGFIDELDPDNSTEDVTYDTPWTNPFPDLLAAAEDELEEDCAGAEWDNGAAQALRAYDEDEEGPTTADAVKAEVRWHVTGGNTGYLRIDWEIIDENAEMVSDGFVVHTWDPGAGTLDDFIAGPLLDADWGDPGEVVTRDIVVTAITCIPPV